MVPGEFPGIFVRKGKRMYIIYVWIPTAISGIIIKYEFTRLRRRKAGKNK